jgi:hypothetical protein
MQVLYTVSTEVILACPMKFSAYPLDKQTCKFLVMLTEKKYWERVSNSACVGSGGGEGW